MAWRPPQFIIWGEASALSYLLLVEVMESALHVALFRNLREIWLAGIGEKCAR